MFYISDPHSDRFLDQLMCGAIHDTHAGIHARDMHAWWGNPCLLCAGGKDQYSGCDGIAVQCNALDPKIGRFARSAPAHDGKVAKCIMP